jgi:hypothetical protein
MTESENPRIARERRTVVRMVDIYCRAHHVDDRVPCDSCQSLVSYAMARLDHCVYGADKPTCRKCPVHCYRKELRAQMREVMVYAGPRMLLLHPALAVRHLFDERGDPPLHPSRAREGREPY